MAAALAVHIARPDHQRAIDKAAIIDKQILVRKAASTEEDPLRSLTEAELVAKAEVTLDLMAEAAKDRPSDMKMLGVRRLRGGDIIVIHVEPVQAGRWLRKPDVLREFEKHFGGTTEACARVHTVIVELVHSGEYNAACCPS
jgi:hypothetical protein